LLKKGSEQNGIKKTKQMLPNGALGSRGILHKGQYSIGWLNGKVMGLISKPSGMVV
jgi:hypothetical protein